MITIKARVVNIEARRPPEIFLDDITSPYETRDEYESDLNERADLC